MKKTSYAKTYNEHYEKRALDRPHQIWKKRTKTGRPGAKVAASKGEVGAIPVHVADKL
jgi:hypothetical protein